MTQSISLKDYSFNIKYHKGFVLMHNSDVAHLANQHPTIWELDVFRKTDGSNDWQRVHHYPNIGYSVNFVKMDPSKPIGNMFSLVPYMSKSLFETSRSRLEVRLGLGVGYAERVFDLHKNPKNIMTSTHLNYCLNGRINYYVKIGKYFNLNAGLGIIHFSNGCFKLPNQGINIPSIHVGIGLNAIREKTHVQDIINPVKKRLLFEIMAAFGLKEEYPILGKKFVASTISAYFNKRMNQKSGLTAGLDLFYDPSVQREITEKVSMLKRSKVAITAGHELFFGKLSLLTQIGFNVYDPYKLHSALYERYGLKYSLFKSWYAQLTMKVYYGSVDYVEWGTGFRF